MIQSTLRALAVVRRGVAAMGGEDALSHVRSVTREIKGQWTDPGQGMRPGSGGSFAVIDEERILSYLDLEHQRYFESYATWTDEGDRYLFINVATPDTGYLATRYFDERMSVSWRSSSELPTLYARLTRRFPEALLRQVLARPEALAFVGQATDRLGPTDLVSWADAVGTRLLLRFDQRSGRLVGTALVRDHPFYGETTREVRYDDFRIVGALTIPYAFDEFVGGDLVHRSATTMITLDGASPRDVSFRPPAGAVALSDDPSTPELRKLGGDLYLIRGPYNCLFEVFDDHVVVAEAGLSTALTEQCIALIRGVARDKPIRYVVATHFHHDHVAGLRPYVKMGATVLTTPDALDVVAQVASVPHVLHPDAYGVPRAAIRSQAIVGSRVIADAHHRLELHDIPNPHVAHMLVAYSPAHRVLFEPDLLDGSPGDPRDAGPYTVALAHAIEEHRFNVATIVPVHGPPVTRAYLDRSLAIRRKHVHR